MKKVGKVRNNFKDIADHLIYIKSQKTLMILHNDYAFKIISGNQRNLRETHLINTPFLLYKYEF